MKTTMLIFSVCLPLFTALTSMIIIFIANRVSVTDGVRKLTRRLLYYFLAVAVTWTGVFFYLFIPDSFAVFYPVYCLGALCVPVLLYAYIRQLIVCTKGEDSEVRRRGSVLLLYIPLFGVTCFLVVLRRTMDLLPLVRSVFSMVYFVLTIRLLWRSYSDTQTDIKSRLIPAGWVILMVVLMLVLVINPLILMFVSHKHISLLLIGLAALLISTQSGILLYNTICRNFELFRESRKIPQMVRKEKVVSLRTPDSCSHHWPFTVQEFERMFQKNKPYLDPHLTLAAIAERMATNRSYVSGFINQTYGMNFNQYLNACRLQEFANLQALRSNEGKSSRELAMKAGFGNYQHYVRAKSANDKRRMKGGGEDEQ
jgi:AraC-like DNA-binding protein